MSMQIKTVAKNGEKFIQIDKIRNDFMATG